MIFSSNTKKEGVRTMTNCDGMILVLAVATREREVELSEATIRRRVLGLMRDPKVVGKVAAAMARELESGTLIEVKVKKGARFNRVILEQRKEIAGETVVRGKKLQRRLMSVIRDVCGGHGSRVFPNSAFNFENRIAS